MSTPNPWLRRIKRFSVLLLVALLIGGAIDWWLGSNLGLWPSTPAARAEPMRQFQIQVVDEQDAPVRHCDAEIICPAGGGASWTKSEHGAISFHLTSKEQVFDVIARADGFATAIKHFGGADGADAASPEGATIALARGDKYQLRLHLPANMPWPEGASPQLYFERYIDKACMYRQPSVRSTYEAYNDVRPLDFNMLNAKPTVPGEFEFQMNATTPAFMIAIHQPGFLQAFDAGPFKPDDLKDRMLDVDVPAPATLEISFDPGGGESAPHPFKSAVAEILTKIPRRRSSILLTSPGTNLDSQPLRFTDLAPNKYTVTVSTLPDGKANTPYTEQPDSGRFTDRREITLKAGSLEKMDVQYVPFNPNAFHGNRAAVVRIETAEGKPAAGIQVKIEFYDGHYGALLVFSGTVPSSGEISLNNLSDAPSPYPSAIQPYSVKSKDRLLGRFGFTPDDPFARFTFHIPPAAGDNAPNVEVTNLTDGKAAHLSDWRGKVVLLDFWATWCGPCQPAMEKLDKLVAKHANDWRGKVQIVPISIDEEPSIVNDHLAGRGWSHLDSYWTGAERKTGWDAPAARAFVIGGVPTSVLIDPRGKIIWIGHPLERDGQELEDQIDSALP
jgi:thiol-disulfide isomerase/thioredoxin